VYLRSNGEGKCSRKTRDDRRQLYFLVMAQLWSEGYKIRKLESLAGKHVRILMSLWRTQQIAARTLHTRLSMIKHLCECLGKHNVVRPIDEYLPEEVVRRSNVAKQSKSWESNDVDPLEIIDLARSIDERLGVILAMQHFFGLRVKESIEMRPAQALVEDGRSIEVFLGTKGGRVRRVQIETDDQQDVFAWARAVAASGNTKRLRWTDCTWKRAQNRFYNLVRKRLGITGKLKGITAHGLRHGYAQRRYRQQTGLPTPVEGGALGYIDRETHQAASMNVSRELGHGRVEVTGSYYGSYEHALRTLLVINMTVRDCLRTSARSVDICEWHILFMKINSFSINLHSAWAVFDANHIVLGMSHEMVTYSYGIV
jgi:integrase